MLSLTISVREPCAGNSQHVVACRDFDFQGVGLLIVSHTADAARGFLDRVGVFTCCREDEGAEIGEVYGRVVNRASGNRGFAVGNFFVAFILDSDVELHFFLRLFRTTCETKILDDFARGGVRVKREFGGGEGVFDGEGVVRSAHKVCDLFRLVGLAGLSHLSRSDRQSAVAFRDFDGQGVDGLVVLHARDGCSGLDFLHSIGVGAFLVEGQLVVRPEEGLRDVVLVFRAGDLDRGHVRNLAGERSSIRIRRSTGDLQLEFLASGRDVGGVGVEGLLEFAGEGELGRSGVTLRDGQCAGFIRDLIVVLVRFAGRRDGRMIADSVIICVCTGDGVGQFLRGVLAVDHTLHCCIKIGIWFCGLFALIVCRYLCFCIVDLELCICVGRVRSVRAFRCVLEGDGNGVLIRFGDTVLVVILHVCAGRRSGRGRPCAGGLTCLYLVGIVRTTDCHLDLDIDELVLRAVRKAVCLRGNIAKDIKAGTVVGLFGFLRENISRCRNLYEHLGVRNLDDFQAILICDACTIVRRLRTTVVVVLNSEFDDELLAVRFAILINTAPVVREVKTSNCDRVILILGCYACRRSGGGFKRSIGLIVRNRQRDTLRICRDSEVAGNLINNQCFFAERGRVGADFFVDRFKNVAERTGAGGCKVKTLIFAEVFIDRTSHSHARCSRIVGRNKVHEAVRIRGFGFIPINAPVVRFRIIRRKCSRIANRRTVKDTDGVDGSLVLFDRCFCIRDCAVCCRMAVTICIPLAILAGTAIREDDHHAGPGSSFKLICVEDTICRLNAFIDIGGAVRL